MEIAQSKLLGGIESAAKATGYSVELLLVARNKIRQLALEGQQGLPIGNQGFDDAGRVYFTDLLSKWLEENKETLESAFDGNREYWLTVGSKFRSLNEQLEYEQNRGRLCKKAEVAELLKRIFSAQNSLLNDRFLQDLPARACLTPEQTKTVADYVAEVLSVMRREGLDKWTKKS